MCPEDGKSLKTADDYLITEYEQIGEEVRYRDKILHQSYYLITIIFGVFVGAVFGNWRSDIAVISGAILAGIVFMSLSLVIELYMRRREAAMVYREELEDRIEEFELQSGIYQSPFQKGEERHTKTWLERRGPHTIAAMGFICGCFWFSIAVYRLMSDTGTVRLILGELVVLFFMLLALYGLKRSRKGEYFYSGRLF